MKVLISLLGVALSAQTLPTPPYKKSCATNTGTKQMIANARVSLDKNDMDTAMCLVVSAAKAGDHEAERYIGNFYHAGLPGIIRKDDCVALKWWRRSAQGGDRAAAAMVRRFDPEAQVLDAIRFMQWLGQTLGDGASHGGRADGDRKFRQNEESHREWLRREDRRQAEHDAQREADRHQEPPY